MIKKIVYIILIGSLLLISVIPCLLIFNFFGVNNVDGYIENNSEYSKLYINALNNNVKKGNGYVSLDRILYFYLDNDNLTFNEIYKDNLRNKKMMSIKEVCKLKKYKYLSVCKEDELNNYNDNSAKASKIFSSPLDFERLNVTSYFLQERILYGAFNIHYAWDFSASNNTEVYSVCDGEVIDVNFKYFENKIDVNGAGGNEIKIKCEVGSKCYIVWYAHLYPNSSRVEVGDEVTKWQQIAEVGKTGNSTGPHLHFQVQLNGKNIDGMNLIDFTNLKNDESNT